MKRRQIVTALAAFGALASLANDALAGGDGRTSRSPREVRVYGYYGDQRGCYWAEGRRHCARYCYWEVDGVRYCQSRERLAVPQGDPLFRPSPPEPPIYPPYHRRLR